MSLRYQKKREHLLDAAEQLFAQSGYHTVSMREIAREAQLSGEEISAYFENKEKIFYAVIERRASVINLLRIEKLTQTNNRDTSIAALKPLLKAFFDPLYYKSREDPRWLNYFRLVLQMMRQRSPILLLVTEFYTPVSDVFLNRLRQILPEVCEERLAKYWHFSILTYFSVFLDDFHVGDFQLGSVDTPKISEQIAANFRHAEAFVLAGFESLKTGDS